MAKITMAEVAITDKDNVDVVFSDHQNGMCNGGIIHDNMSEELKSHLTGIVGKQIICKGYTLETVCNQYLTPDEINKISFIKIDTEGYDREIVQSSSAFLNKHKPCLFIEWFAFYKEADSLKLFQVIENANYIPFHPVTLKPATVTDYLPDLLLIHKEDNESLAKTNM